MFRYRELLCFLLLLTSAVSTEFMNSLKTHQEDVVYEGLLDRIVDDTYLVFLLEEEKEELILEAPSLEDIKVGQKYRVILQENDGSLFHIIPIREYTN